MDVVVSLNNHQKNKTCLFINKRRVKKKGWTLTLNSPKQFDLVQIKAPLACELNEMWHSRLPKIHYSNVVRNKHYVCFGAMYDSKYFAVAIWSSPVARFLDSTKYLELRRLAISKDCPKFTATWMIGRMVKDIKDRFPNIETLISYQDSEVHTGTIYKAANWTRVETKSTGSGWSSRKRSPLQTTALKIRWEYDLRKHP